MTPFRVGALLLSFCLSITLSVPLHAQDSECLKTVSGAMSYVCDDPNWRCILDSSKCKSGKSADSHRPTVSDAPGPARATPQIPQTSSRANTLPARPQVPEQVADVDGFRDVLGRITSKKGNGSEALDDLMKQTKPSPSSPRPPLEQPTFVAFAQSAGFDANGGFGYASGGNLNATIGRANAECSSRAGTSCGDEGYCTLRPGLWGAWASDQKYLGNKAFACNLRTEDEAVDQALAWCGFDCTVLWKGSAQ